MKKELKEDIVRNVELLKSFLKFSDDFFEKNFCNTKEAIYENVLNAILADLEKC